MLNDLLVNHKISIRKFKGLGWGFETFYEKYSRDVCVSIYLWVDNFYIGYIFLNTYMGNWN